jgi:hypothetical protein
MINSDYIAEFLRNKMNNMQIRQLRKPNLEDIIKNILVLIILISIPFRVLSQPCSSSDIYFETQAQIDNFSTIYPNCTEILGCVSIYGNDITNLHGLSAVTSIRGSLDILINPSLKSLAGLDNLKTVGGTLRIFTHVKNLTGLNQLKSIGGYLKINSPELTNLEGMNNLDSIGWYLEISESLLTNLHGLESVTSIGELIQIEFNKHLKSLIGLDNVNAGTLSSLYIYQNDSLSFCATKTICDFIASHSGSVDFSDNAMGCNSRAEVDSACTKLSVENFYKEIRISTYPNPVIYQIIIENPANQTFTISIVNLTGQELIILRISEPRTQIDIHDLPGGLYFIRLTDEKTIKVGKFIK